MSRKKYSLKTVYYSSFMLLVVVPVILVLIVSLTILNRVFRQQAVENIKRAQEAVSAELVSDIEQISMRLSHMVYANNNELLDIAARTDTDDYGIRYESQQDLNEAASYATEPVKDIVSVAFYMKDGRQTFFKNDILIPVSDIRKQSWYRDAGAGKDRVVLGSYNTNHVDLYSGGSRDSFVLVAALSPDVSLDRSQKIDMVCFFQVTGASDKIKSYNTGYRQKKNKIGYTRIVDKEGRVIYEPQGIQDRIVDSKGYTRVISPLFMFEDDWYVESYIRSSELTIDFWIVAGMLLLAMAVVLGFYAAFSKYFLKTIIHPVQQISHGMRRVEEGELDVHITPSGQYEVRTLIHSFNAMVRRLKALIADYEERIKRPGKTASDYMTALVRGEMSPEEVQSQAADFFSGKYVLFAVAVGRFGGSGDSEGQKARELAAGFDTIPRFASRCTLDMITRHLFIVYYRITEHYYEDMFLDMIKELQRFARTKMEVELCICVGRAETDYRCFGRQVEELMRFYDLYVLEGEEAVLDLNQDYDRYARLAERAPAYAKLAAALYIADEKTISEEKELLLQEIQAGELDTSRERILSVILATARQFVRADADFNDIFGQKINYVEKLWRIEDKRSLRLWLGNYFSWVSDYSSSRLNVAQMDSVTKAKHYIMEHYQDSGLTLKEVAEYVDLNEKYFTTKFTKECGETFLSYLTGLRVQKAKELIKTTTFKMYEIAEMVGYNNAEHFNRIFKKAVGMSPAQYRKA